MKNAKLVFSFCIPVGDIKIPNTQNLSQLTSSLINPLAKHILSVYETLRIRSSRSSKFIEAVSDRQLHSEHEIRNEVHDGVMQHGQIECNKMHFLSAASIKCWLENSFKVRAGRGKCNVFSAGRQQQRNERDMSDRNGSRISSSLR